MSDKPSRDIRDIVVPLKETIAEVEKRYILGALEATNWVQARAAKMLGISQRILGYKMKKYGITIKPKGGVKDEKDEKVNQNY